ncbi:MAG: hypothetical protein ACT4PU_08435 [Planctomycetota bacterium]
MSAKYLAGAIHDSLASLAAELGGTTPLSAKEIDELRAIATGKPDATRYQDKVMRLLSIVFDASLVLIDKEVKQHSGRKRIDIAFRNAADGGFFGDLGSRHNIKCPFIPVECKNITADVKNSAFDQLAGRLTDKVGKFGILACRSKFDAARIAQRVLDLANAEKKFVLVLDDEQIESLVRMKLVGDEDGIDAFLHEHFRPLLLN